MVFGEETVTKLYDVHWALKEQGLGECEKKLQDGNALYTRDTYRASIQVVHKAIKDRIAQVVLKGMNLLETTLRIHEADPLRGARGLLLAGDQLPFERGLYRADRRPRGDSFQPMLHWDNQRSRPGLLHPCA